MPPLLMGICMESLKRKIRISELDIDRAVVAARSCYRNFEIVEERLERIHRGSTSAIDEVQRLLAEQRSLFAFCDTLAERNEAHKPLLAELAIKTVEAESASKLVPEIEFERMSKKGQRIIESLGIDLSSKVAPLDREIEAKDRINRVVSTPAFKKELDKYFHEPRLSEIIESFKSMTISEIASSGMINQKAYNMITQAKRGKNEALAVLGQPLVDEVNKLIAASPVSRADAMAFAKSINIDTKAVNALKKSDYSGKAGQDRLEADIADLYRLSGGAIKIGTLTKTPRDSRAHYTRSFNHINVGSGFDKATLWHELTHSIEYEHPRALQAVKGFLAKRLKMAEANGSGIKQLKAIYPRNGYRRDEVAIEDSAFSHYVTKLYRLDKTKPFSTDNIRSSEVLTMGIESLSDPYLAGQLLNEDPDHAAFVLGVLTELREKL